MRARHFAAAAAAVVSLGLAGCGSAADGDQAGAAAAAGDRLTVVATTTQVADFARNVGGDLIKLTQLLKPNVDPHDYESSPADILAISDARVVVRNGVGLEKFLDGAISSAGFTGKIVDASAGVAVRTAAEEDEPEGDPHIWHNPRHAMIMAKNVADAFAAADPGDATSYQANYARYAAELDTMDRDIQRQIDALPAGQRKLVTNHDAFGYYIERYRLEFVGSIIPSFDSSAELSGKDISDLIAKIKATGVTAIFSESSLPPRTAETIGREAGVRVVGGADALYGDTLGPAGSPADTYLRMMRHNTETIVGALESG